MPKITVAAPFNYGLGPTVKHYAKGEHDVPQSVAAHAAAHGFLGAGTLTITDLETGAVSGPHAIESLTLPGGKK